MYRHIDENEHFRRLNRYYNFSRWKYNFFLKGSKHFGFYPDEKFIATEKAQELMQDLVAEKIGAAKGLRILDAGCGQGVTSTFIAKKYGCIVEGITMVSFEVDAANELAKKIGVASRVHYSLMDYSKLDFPDNFFDAIYTQESLVHSTDIERTLKEFYRVLKTHGRAALFEYTMAEDDKFSKKELQIMYEMNYASAMNSLPYMRHDKFDKLITNAGFREIKIENISRRVAPMLETYEKFARFIYFFMSIFGLANKMPNLVAVALMRKFGGKDLVRYNIFTAYK